MLYVPSRDHDVMLEIWYHQLRLSGDLDRLFRTEQRALSGFLRTFQPPTELVILTDHAPQIIAAAWFDPSPFIGAWTGLWVHPSSRRSRKTLQFLIGVYSAALEVWPILYGLTQQESLLEPFRRFGYIIVTTIPNAWDGHPAWLFYLTQASFEGSPSYGAAQNSWSRNRLQPEAREHQREPC